MWSSHNVVAAADADADSIGPMIPIYGVCVHFKMMMIGCSVEKNHTQIHIHTTHISNVVCVSSVLEKSSY